MIRDNVYRILEHMASICRRLNRDPKEITLVAVTKYATAKAIQEALGAGIKDVGENKVQMALEKFPQLKSNATKHLIGHLQTNKARYAVKVFDLIQSVGSLKLAQEINKEALKIGKVMDILIQVNTSKEEQKFGADKNEVLALVGSIAQLKNLKIRGLMTMAPYTENKNVIRSCFRDLRLIRDQVTRQLSHVDMKYLSMGMSGDYEIALEEGSNMVRIGSAIFKEN